LVQDSQSSDDDDAGAPAAAVYESHSGGIVETLEGLRDKAEGQLSDARKTETVALHNFEMLKQSLEDSIKFADEDMAEAKKGLAEAGEKKSAAEGDLEVTQKDLKADIEQKADLHHDCMTKAEDYEAATKSRGEELAALAKAKKVIKESTGGAEDIAYGLEQVSFFQRSRMASSADIARIEAVRFVRDLARKHNAPQLAQLASRMASAMRSEADPFAKVMGLISDMITRLEEEAAADATEKAYCDKELKETNAKKDDKDAEIAKLTTSIDQMTAKSASLKEHVAQLQNALAEIAASQAEMDKLRAEEKKAYDSNKAEMEEGLEGVKLALKVLQEYYAKDDKAHGAAEGAAAGIIGLLEVCESDFSKDLAEIVSTEETAVTSYERATKENEIETAAKTQDVKYKTQEATGLDKQVNEATSDRDGVQEELDAILEYLDKLNERCVAKAETYAERKAARDQEIAGLKEALQILDGQSALIQTKRSFRQRKTKLDINQKVYIENAPVLGDGAGEAALNNCQTFAAQHVSNPAAPTVKVCGTGIKATVFLRNRCEGYYEHHEEIGSCNTGLSSTSCQSFSPAQNAAFGHYQSYLIEQC
jgi:chromosome segregation ATPase